MSQAAFTRELRRALRRDGEATILLADLDVPRFTLDTDEEFRARRVARARQRLYWLAAVGRDSLPVRVLVGYDELPADVLDPGPDWPELFGSYDEMMDAQGGDR